MFKSNYRYEWVDGVLFLEDLNGDMSLTNDMERVLMKIESESARSLNGTKIIYRDSEGIIDRVMYNNGSVSFISLNSSTLSNALEVVNE